MLAKMLWRKAQENVEYMHFAQTMRFADIDQSWQIKVFAAGNI